MTRKNTPPGPSVNPGGEVAAVVRSEWTKFRTVRGWIVSLLIAALVSVVFTYLVANGKHETVCPGNGTNCTTGHPLVPIGPAGEAVADSYYFLNQPLTGNGTITARVTTLTGVKSTLPAGAAPSLANTGPGLAPWAKAGILLTPSLKEGSPYAAVMTTGSHGVHWQYDYTNDTAGLAGSILGNSPRWLRLTRTGDTLTSYDSTDGKTWTRIGHTVLAGLPATVSVGLFVTSPVIFDSAGNAFPTRATATFDSVTIKGTAAHMVWQGHTIGGPGGPGLQNFYPTLGAGNYHQSGGSLVLSGSGDIAPAVGGELTAETASSALTLGLLVELMVLSVIATLFITAEYRRGLIRTTLAATPRRGRVLAAKAIVIGAVAFLIGGVAAVVAVPLGEQLLTAHGNYIFPTTPLTALRIIIGSGTVAALTAIAVLGIGTIVRNSAAAVTGGIAVFVLPSIGALFIPGSAAQWLLAVTPAAGLSLLGAPPSSALVDNAYTFANGYYPLTGWEGLAVLCAYAALAMAGAALMLRRRDA
jgi:hypothetical protein